VNVVLPTVRVFVVKAVIIGTAMLMRDEVVVFVDNKEAITL